MKKLIFFMLFAATTIVTACNNSGGSSSKTDEPGSEFENTQAIGTVIGSYSNGFGSLLVQVDDEYPIGGPIEVPSTYSGDMYTYQPYPCATLKNETDETIIYQNMIQVQWDLPVEEGDRISFSIRKFHEEEDQELFTRSMKANAYCAPPEAPIYVITEYEPINN
jgi:hypothetical protein